MFCMKTEAKQNIFMVLLVATDLVVIVLQLRLLRRCFVLLKNCEILSIFLSIDLHLILLRINGKCYHFDYTDIDRFHNSFNRFCLC